MKFGFYSILILFGLGIFSACSEGVGSSDTPVLKGQIEGAAGMQLFFDEFGIERPSNSISNTSIDEKGNFELALPDPLVAGVYRVRIGTKRTVLILDGSEK